MNTYYSRQEVAAEEMCKYKYCHLLNKESEPTTANNYFNYYYYMKRGIELVLNCKVVVDVKRSGEATCIFYFKNNSEEIFNFEF